MIDSDINDTDEAKGEPDVTVNGKELRMVQAVDGNWYGYFADRNQAQLADQTIEDWNTLNAFSLANGIGLDFGTFCDNNSEGLQNTEGATAGNLVFSVSDSVGVAVSGDVTGGVQGTDTIEGNLCDFGSIDENTGGPNVHVVREPKDVNTNAPDENIGQVNIDIDAWPFIQLYPLNPTGNVVIQYNKGGGAQTTTLTFDTVDQFAGAELDRATYTVGSEVMVTITDLWLNIDPTDEDSWTFSTVDNPDTAVPEIYSAYQVFDENGNQDDDA